MIFTVGINLPWINVQYDYGYMASQMYQITAIKELKNV
jgi:hypothetical protein